MRQLKIQKSITNRSSEALDKYLVEIGRAPLISIDEEIELAQKIKKGGRDGERAKEKLVTANLRFVVSVAKQYQHQGLSLTDLIDEVIDRFGSPSRPAERLFLVSRIRVQARRLGIGSILDEGQTLLIVWADEEPMRRWNMNRLPHSYMSKLHFLPGAPARVRIKKADIQGNTAKWMSDFIEEITKEIYSGEKRA